MAFATVEQDAALHLMGIGDSALKIAFVTPKMSDLSWAIPVMFW